MFDSRFPGFAIVSAERGALPASINRARTTTMRALLDSVGASYVEAAGVYCGTREHSFVIFQSPGIDARELARDLGRQFGQDSILWAQAGPRHAAFLEYVTGERAGEIEPLGFFRPVNPATLADDAPRTECNGRVFACLAY